MSDTILHSNGPRNLFGLQNPSYKDAKVVVLQVPYDSATTYGSGARDGPHAIIESSRYMEIYDEESGKSINNIGIYTHEEMEPSLASPEENVKRVEKEVTSILDDSKFPLVIGGDHTVAIGPIRSMSKKYGKKEFSVLHFDAHSDSYDQYMGTKYSHACVMARARELCDKCYSVGVRSIDENSAKRYASEILYRKKMHNLNLNETISTILKRTLKRVYITIDLDVLDTSIMPSVGNPEPDGLSFYELTSILKGILKERDLIGIDINELSPIPGNIAPDYLAAKLIFRVLGYAFFK